MKFNSYSSVSLMLLNRRCASDSGWLKAGKMSKTPLQPETSGILLAPAI
jgi:hypothetical protein